MARKRLGEILQEKNKISAEALTGAIEEQATKSILLGELLLDRGLVPKEDLVASLEEVTRFRYIDPRFADVDHAVLEVVPRSAATKYCVLPMVREGTRIICVMAEPQNLRALDELRFLTGAEIVPRLGFRSEINEAIQRCYGEIEEPGTETGKRLSFIQQVDVSDVQFFTDSTNERNRAAIAEFEAEMRQEKTPAVRLASALITAAVAKKASDIHIEPQALGTVVRVRVDGVLREMTQVPTDLQNSLVSRVKILADMDIAERRVPQDGRFLVRIGGRNLDVRVSTLPTHYGEKLVMRLLNSESTRVQFTELGFSEDIAASLATILKMPQGMLLVTGPTGAGKSTTLYAALNFVHSPNINVITVEDPIEYKIAEINQVQVNPKAGLTFPICLRSILRQDPNVIMVGEVRDVETAEIALRAAQTGHMVLSTLHTNDAVAGITRLIDLGIPPFLISSSMTAIIAQRLVRMLCSCRGEEAVTNDYARRLMAAGITDFGSRIYVPGGCPRCDDTGYKGRMGIYEMLVMDEQIRSSIRTGIRDDEVRSLARSCGMRTMREDALEKVKSGITTFEEAMRVVSFDQSALVGCQSCGKAMAANFLFCPYCGTARRPVESAPPAARAERAPRKGEALQ